MPNVEAFPFQVALQVTPAPPGGSNVASKTEADPPRLTHDVVFCQPLLVTEDAADGKVMRDLDSAIGGNGDQMREGTLFEVVGLMV